MTHRFTNKSGPRHSARLHQWSTGSVFSTRGASLVEYGILTGLVSVFAISAIAGLGREVAPIFSDTAALLRSNEDGPVVGNTTTTSPPRPVYAPEQATWLFGTPGTDRLSMTSDHIGVVGYDGSDDLSGTSTGHIYIAGPGDDTMTGNGGRDVFVYYSGDGNDVIYEEENTDDGVQAVLDFPDLNPDQVVFDQASGGLLSQRGLKTLYIETPGGQKITLDKQFVHIRHVYGVNSMTFADGTELDEPGIRAKMIEDMKPTGKVFTTNYGDIVRHNSTVDADYVVYGDTSWKDPILVLEDAGEADFTIINNEYDDATLTVHGDRIGIDDQFGGYDGGGFDKIVLSDGSDFTYTINDTVLSGRYAIAAKAIEDMKPTGMVYGWRGADQTYVHKLGGDGSYTVVDRVNPGRNTLIVPGVTLDRFDASNACGSMDAYLHLRDSGEMITVRSMFWGNPTGDPLYGFSTIILDDATLSTSDVAQIVANGSRNGGTICGTNYGATYTHYLADPELRIETASQYGVKSTLHLPDLYPDDVIFNNILNTTNTMIYHNDGDEVYGDGTSHHGMMEVYLPKQTSWNGGVDFVKFADGSIIDRDGILSRVGSDPYPPTSGG